MKKLVSFVMALFFLCSVAALPVYAAGSTSITLVPSSSTVRIGDTITVTGNFNGSMIGTFDINITYNTAQLRFVSMTVIPPVVVAGEIDPPPVSNGSIHLLYLDADGGLTGITTGGAFKLTFTVIGGNVGDKISAAIQILTVGDSAAVAMTATGSPAVMTLAAPLSGNTSLSSLSASNGTLTPVFSKNVLVYAVSVPFSVEKLNVAATPEDPASKVSIDSPALKAGAATDVSVTVTAPSGAKKTYVITVTRAQDPNYKAGSNANLKSLVPDQGLLSPAFSAAVTDYVVYLPFEVTSFNASAEMEDEKALGAAGTEIQLEVGENTYTMTGKAEDGTEKVYTIVVNRMPEVGGSASESEPVSGSDEFTITISGILTDSQGNPLAGKIIELHSVPQIITTDTKGFYRFTNVSEGSHTLFIKEKDGTEIGRLPILITRGDQTAADGNNIFAKGDTTLDLSLNNGELSIKDVIETAVIPVSAGVNGVPAYLTVLLVLAGILCGVAAGYFLPWIGKRNRDDEEQEAKIVL